jgi:hypothetical protein
MKWVNNEQVSGNGEVVAQNWGQMRRFSSETTEMARSLILRPEMIHRFIKIAVAYDLKIGPNGG